MIYVVFESLQKKEDIRYYSFEYHQIKILIFLYIGEVDINHVIYSYGTIRYISSIYNFFYELDSLYNTKELIKNKRYIDICCEDYIDCIYVQKVYYDKNIECSNKYNPNKYHRSLVEYTENTNELDNFCFLYFTFCKFCRKIHFLEENLYIIECLCVIPFFNSTFQKQIHNFFNFTDKEIIKLPTVKMQYKDSELNYIYDMFL